MRVFIAIDLPKEVKNYLFELQKELSGFGKINWVAKKNLHLTLKFLGDINEEKLGEVKESLKQIKISKFKIFLSDVGVFPKREFIRVVWAGLKPAEVIMELQKKIDELLLDKFSSDQRFQAHLTLGRVKFLKDKKGFLDKIDNINVKKIDFEVDCFKLVKSDLTKDGPKYTILESYDLI